MIGKTVQMYCCEDISKIENYDKAVSDKTQVWQCHHKLELIETGGVVNASRKDLTDWGLYYSRPADELIFLTIKQHMLLHNGHNFNEEHKNKIGIGVHKARVVYVQFNGYILTTKQVAMLCGYPSGVVKQRINKYGYIIIDGKKKPCRVISN